MSKRKPRKRGSQSLSNANDTADTSSSAKAESDLTKRSRVSQPKGEPVDTTQPIFYGYEEEFAYLDQLVRTLFQQNKANSVIICGDSGFGKNRLVDACLNKYPIVRGDDDSEYEHLKVVHFRFDGYLHGKNELATLRIIGRKLNQFLEKARQVTLEDDESDTEFNHEDLSNKVASSIPKIISQFHFLTQHCPNFRCIITLNHLEMFTGKQQYLLYNLFDLIQQGHSILIIGLTRRLDCIQLLTGRVQSRLNRRMIHLVAPFKSLDFYSKFCLYYGKQINANLESDDKAELEKEIAKSFEFPRGFNEIKRFVQEYSFVLKEKAARQQSRNEEPKSGVNKTIFLGRDPKIVDLLNLARNETYLLVIANKQLRHRDTETFTCKQLHEWAIRVPQMKSIRYEQVVKCIYKMIESDLLIVTKETRSQSSKAVQLWITPWTSLMLNISQIQMNEYFKAIGDKVPAFLKQLLA